jgi:outer membrane protein assembly factor BamD (BamD/ComL family)
MKKRVWILLAVMSLSLAVFGCGKAGSVDTSKLVSSFKSAPPAQQSDVDQIVSAIQGGSYSQAVTDLQSLASEAKLTPQQQRAIKDTIAALQAQMTKTAGKAAGDLQKSLPK